MGNKTALYDAHVAMGGKLVDFGGWDMPLHYGSQIEEHHIVRQQAGMFDVSHMTVVDVTGDDAKAYLQYLLANDVARLDGLLGKALYSAMLNERGGVIDDLIVYNTENGYRLVVNCGTRDKDMAWMQQQVGTYNVSLQERTDVAMVAIQGPQARALCNQVLSAAQQHALQDCDVFQGVAVDGWFLARTGYTGEDGLEIILPNSEVAKFWQALATAGVRPCGLGARDTLRLEAGMNLYGNEMDDDTSPLVANMGWTIAWQPETRDFIGRTAISAEKAAGVTHKLVGLVLQERGVLRAHQTVTADADDSSSAPKGEITSGTFSPTLGYSVALARVPVGFADNCIVEVRKKQLLVRMVKPCFVRNGSSLIDA